MTSNIAASPHNVIFYLKLLQYGLSYLISDVAVAPYAVNTAIEPDDDSDEEMLKKKTYYNSLNIWVI